jgi:hypothetical protein
MGGGALKIEAINLKSLHFPKSIIQNLSTLETIGRELVSDTASPQEFQRRIAEAMDLQESAKLLHNLHKRLSEERNLR